MKIVNNLTKNEANYSTIIRYIPILANVNIRNMSWVVLFMATSNFLTHTFFNPNINGILGVWKKERLYLMEKASIYVEDIPEFENKVRKISQDLDIPPEWLMSVMYSESRFDAGVVNAKGSGAVGLIQFMPETANELGTTTWHLKDISHTEQLEYVYRYLDKNKQKYGRYESLTELYLAILFPKALGGDDCFLLYAKPSQAYKQNIGLDENHDGAVTASDIDRRMQRLFPKAYMIKNTQIAEK